jgi:hypothetical protein
MPDTALPPLGVTENVNHAARIGTSNDTSWAGWAISSFTNKVTAAKGEIQHTNGDKPAVTEPARPASVPRPATSSPSVLSSRPKEELRPTAPSLARSLSDRPVTVSREEEEETDDVYDAWGAMDDDDGAGQTEDNFLDATTSLKETSSPASTRPATAVFDDGGEPDFAGWLAAQSKGKAKKPLPKGLGKSASTKEIPSRPATTLRTASVNAAKTKPAAPSKPIDTKPKDEAEDDDWGAWD